MYLKYSFNQLGTQLHVRNCLSAVCGHSNDIPFGGSFCLLHWGIYFSKGRISSWVLKDCKCLDERKERLGFGLCQPAIFSNILQWEFDSQILKILSIWNEWLCCWWAFSAMVLHCLQGYRSDTKATNWIGFKSKGTTWRCIKADIHHWICVHTIILPALLKDTKYKTPKNHSTADNIRALLVWKKTTH